MNEIPKYKQVIIVRTDLGMSIGKTAVQVAHASLTACRSSDNQNIVEAWFYEYPGQRKIVVAVNSEAELMQYFSLAFDSDLPVSLIRDAGFTELPPNTATAVAIGPDVDWKVDAITSKLKLLK